MADKLEEEQAEVVKSQKQIKDMAVSIFWANVVFYFVFSTMNLNWVQESILTWI